MSRFTEITWLILQIHTQIKCVSSDLKGSVKIKEFKSTIINICEVF